MMFCKYVLNLGCEDTDPKRLNVCRHCGWNPEVAQQRAEKIRSDRAQKTAPSGGTLRTAGRKAN